MYTCDISELFKHSLCNCLDVYVEDDVQNGTKLSIIMIKIAVACVGFHCSSSTSSSFIRILGYLCKNICFFVRPNQTYPNVIVKPKILRFGMRRLLIINKMPNMYNVNFYVFLIFLHFFQLTLQ